LSALALAAIVWKVVFSPARPVPDLSLDWVCSLSVDRYLPMLRLLDESDLRFLEVQPGFTEALVQRVREHRYRMFVAYLKSLRRDFDGLTAALKQIMTSSDHDCASLASTLLRAEVGFSWAFVMAYARAYVWRKGLGTVDAQELLRAFQGIHVELRMAAPKLGAA
jgi:hypothetical protein